LKQEGMKALQSINESLGEKTTQNISAGLKGHIEHLIETPKLSQRGLFAHKKQKVREVLEQHGWERGEIDDFMSEFSQQLAWLASEALASQKPDARVAETIVGLTALQATLKAGIDNKELARLEYETELLEHQLAARVK